MILTGKGVMKRGINKDVTLAKKQHQSLLKKQQNIILINEEMNLIINLDQVKIQE